MNASELLFPEPTPPSETDVKVVEAKIGTRLPSDYREFILKTGGGVPSESCYSNGNGINVYVQNIFTVGDPKSPIDLAKEIISNPASRGLLKSRIPVATANGGDYLMIHKRKGIVYLWDHETNNVSKVCESWNDLLAGIKPDFNK